MGITLNGFRLFRAHTHLIGKQRVGIFHYFNGFQKHLENQYEEEDTLYECSDSGYNTDIVNDTHETIYVNFK